MLLLLQINHPFTLNVTRLFRKNRLCHRWSIHYQESMRCIKDACLTRLVLGHLKWCVIYDDQSWMIYVFFSCFCERKVHWPSVSFGYHIGLNFAPNRSNGNQPAEIILFSNRITPRNELRIVIVRHGAAGRATRRQGTNNGPSTCRVGNGKRPRTTQRSLPFPIVIYDEENEWKVFC
jgi:hypothetical protein